MEVLKPTPGGALRGEPGKGLTPRVAPRRRTPWPIWAVTAVVFAASVCVVVFYYQETAGWVPRAATPLGRWYGWIGTGLAVLLVLYTVRRPAYRGRLGSLEFWYRTHLWLSVLVLALIGAHTGFRFRGLFLTLLQLFFWGGIASGLIGWLLQTRFKALLARREERPLVMSEILADRETERSALLGALLAPRLRLLSGPRGEGEGAAAQAQAERAAAVQSARAAEERLLDAVGQLRRRHFRRFPSWQEWDHLVAEECGATTARDLEGLEPAESDAAVTALQRLNHLEVLTSYHRWMRGWTTLHLALALGMLQLVLWHIYFTTTY